MIRMSTELKCEYDKKTLHRIHRIQGQLAALEAKVAADEGTCQERVIQGRAIEKAVTSLISHMVECYLINTARDEMATDPDSAVQEIARIFELLND
jgi:DNA-binding FrmR family transcriptional regulator